MNLKRNVIHTIAVLVIVQLAGCSSGPPPKQELTLTQSSIRNAEAAGAVSYAPKPYREAQQKVEVAEAYIEKKKYDKAKRLLISATADAELAEATAEAEKSKLAHSELQESVDLMKKEIARVQDN